MSNTILENYSNFVAAVTSKDSNDETAFASRLMQLMTESNKSNVNIALLTTGAIGMAAEAGEFADIVKKVLFHGKPLDEENRKKLLLELGDVIWYWINTCRALNLDPEDVIRENVKKLESRYPGGKFDVHHSENRAKDDI